MFLLSFNQHFHTDIFPTMSAVCAPCPPADVDAGASDSTPASLTQGAKARFPGEEVGVLALAFERITHFLPNGSYKEELPKTAAGNRLDMVRFNDFFLKTNDDELADAIKASKQWPGVLVLRRQGEGAGSRAGGRDPRCLRVEPRTQKALKLLRQTRRTGT